MEKLKICANPALPTSYTEALSYLEDLGKLRYELDQVIKAVNAGQTFYILPIATAETAGGVKAISKTDESHKVAIDADGQIWSAYPTTANNQTLGLVKGTVKTDEDAMVAVDENGEMWYKTPEIATDKIAGIVKAVIKDAQTHKVAIDTDGQLYSDYPNVATAETAGLVRGNKKTANQTTPVGIASDGRMFVDTSVDIPQATSTTIGGVKANSATSDYTGDVRIDSNGKLKVKEYTLPVASTNVGGLRVATRTNQNHAVGIDKNNQFLYSDYPANATNETAGIVKAKAKTDETVEVAVDTDGKLYVPANAGITVASDTEIGGIKAKSRTNEDRKVAVGTDGYAYYKVPQASALEVGGIKAEPRTTETNEVRIDTTTGKLYAGSGGIASIPKASANSIGGILADPATIVDNRPVRISTDGHLFAQNTRTTDAASTENIGGITVGAGGNDQGNPPTTQNGFFPDATNYPLMVGTRIPYSVDTVNNGMFETYNTEVYIDLSETPADQITPTKLNNYISYADTHGYSLYIHAADNSNILRDFYDTGKVVGEDRTFATRPYTVNGKLNIAVLTINTEGEYSYDITETPIEPEVVLPARENRYGTIKAATRTANETAEVKIDTATGKLYAPAAGGGTGGDSPYMVYDCGTTLTLKPAFWTDFLHPCLRAGKLPMIKLKQGTQGRQFTFTCDTVYNNEPLESNLNELYFKAIQNINLTSAGDDANSIDIRVFKLPIATQQSGVIVWELGNIPMDVV